MKTRYLTEQVKKDLTQKMVFLGGPRQVGKTTLAKSLLHISKGYLNWDVSEHRECILKKEFPSAKLWVFDEIHKYRTWRNYYLRMHPLSFAELKLKNQNDLLDLLKLGGFPEPYFSASEIEAKRWTREYRTRLIREDLVQLERVHDIGNVELLAMRLQNFLLL